jgi:hypothetical protein
MNSLSLITSKELECAYFHGFLVHGQATSARTPLNSMVKYYKLAIQVSFITLWHLELSKVLSLVVFIRLSSMNSNWGVSFHSTLVTITQIRICYKTNVSHKYMVVIYHRNTPLPKVRKGLDGYSWFYCDPHEFLTSLAYPHSTQNLPLSLYPKSSYPRTN